MKVKLSGNGLVLNFNDVNKNSLSRKLSEILLNKKYLGRAQVISQQFRDNPVHPMEEAMFWIEYVIRYKGAKHLKSSAVDMDLYQYLLWDVVAFLALCLVMLLFTCFLVGKLVFITLQDNARKHFEQQEKKET
jgi:glucuronosyltransferase